MILQGSGISSMPPAHDVVADEHRFIAVWPRPHLTAASCRAVTALVVSGLARPEYLFEIEAMAMSSEEQ
jgi:hypothetical protein